MTGSGQHGERGGVHGRDRDGLRGRGPDDLLQHRVAHAPPAMKVIAGEMMSNSGLLVPAMVTIGVASVVIGDRASYTSQPATRRLARTPTGPQGPRLRWRGHR